jgi:putative peptidoglycan lipid II flippase
MSVHEREAMPAVDAPKPKPESFARAATLTSIGNFTSRIVGLIFVTVKSFFFGNGQAASAFELAANIPTQFYDLLIGGMLSSALVPTFSALNDKGREDNLREFGQLLGALIGLATVALVGLIAVLWVFALPIATFISGGPNQDPNMVAGLLRFTIPAILFLNLSGILTGALQARRKFGFTAFTATIFNVTAIACVVLFQSQWGVASLAIGMVLGSLAQVLVQLPGLRGVPVKLSLNWRLPGVSQVIRLFLPVAGGLVVAQIAVQVSFILASRISEQGPATMRYAAQVIQFPLGMVSVAIAAAILPALSSSTGEAFKATLAQGLRLVWVLILPASIGLYVLATPVIALLFQHGAFTVESTAYTASALRAAVPGLLFAAIDPLLIFAFYAQRDTRTPTLIGLASTFFYLVWVGVLSLLAQNGARPFTLDDLILANSLKIGVDMLLMGFFLWRRIGGLAGYGLAQVGVKVVVASAAMGGAVWLAMRALQPRFPLDTFAHDVIVAVGCAVLGGAVYWLCANALQVRELVMVGDVVKRRLARR